MTKVDAKVSEIWKCAYKYDHCLLEFIGGRKKVISVEEVRYLLKQYEKWQRDNDLTVIEGTNSNLVASIDDRFPRFMCQCGMVSIQFVNEEDLRCQLVK